MSISLSSVVGLTLFCLYRVLLLPPVEVKSLDVAPRLAFLPAAAMFLTVLSFNLVGDTLRALTDPRQGAL